MSFNCSIISLLVFGGKDNIIGSESYEDAFARAFSPDYNKGAWAAIGAAPITRACLIHDMVCHNSKDDPQHVLYKKIQDSNDTTCALLTVRGFGGSNLRVELKRNLLTPGTVIQPDSKERIEALANAKSHGARFLITGGRHMCTEDTFKALELKACREKRDTKKKEKAACVAAGKIEEEALAILEIEDANTTKKFTRLELHTLLSFYGVEKKNHSKNVAEMRANYT